MTVLVTDPDLSRDLIAQRQESGGDRFDEVWEGLYIMAPIADDEHQDLQGGFVAALRMAAGWDTGILIRAGVNVSDRHEGWVHNYRCPDVVAFLPDTKAINNHTHWTGGPDFAVEIVSRGDRSRDKLEFYAAVGTRELLIVDRDPWTLELYRLQAGALQLVGTSDLASSSILNSEVLPIALRLTPGPRRPIVELTQRDTRQTWKI
jgi:Uma2 family endonuclease